MVSAVVLSYNRCNEVLITIGKLKKLAHELPFFLEVIVVDNASTDDTSVQVKTQYPSVVLVTKETNNGIAGWNDGFEKATQKYLLVLDDDSHPKSGLAEAIAYLNAHDDVGILALNVTTGPYLSSMWKWKDKEDILGFLGCGAIIKRSVYETIGGFAEWLHVYGHEWEYAVRCLDAGYRIQYFENSSIIHRASSVNRSKKRMYTYSARNEMGIIYKYFPQQRWKYIARMFFNGLKFVLVGGFNHSYYHISGAVKFYKMRKNLSYTPVTPQAQAYYAERFWGTQPVFGNMKRRISNLLKK